MNEVNLDIFHWLYQNIFNGKVRFKSQTNEEFPEWEYIQLKDIVNIKHAQKGLIDVDKLEEGKYPFYTVGGIYKHIPFYEMEEEYIALNHKGAPGEVIYAPRCTSFNNAFLYLTIKEDIEYNLKFLFYQMQSIHYNKYIYGATIKHLKWNDLKHEKIHSPCPEEQYRIVQFVDCIVDSVKQLDKEIQLLKEFKKGLLQQMFI